MLQVIRVSLDPAKKTVSSHKVEGRSESKTSSSQPPDSRLPERANKHNTTTKQDHPPDQTLPTKATSHKVVNLVRSSKFRHIEGQLSHRSSAIDKVPTISSTVPGDSNAFAVNKERVGVVLSMAGGQVAILEVSYCLPCRVCVCVCKCVCYKEKQHIQCCYKT